MRDPDFSTDRGLAWEIKKTGPEWDACLSFYYVKLPGHHPMIEWFVVAMSHLRPSSSAPKPRLQDGSCTHELIIAAINPEDYLFEDLDLTKNYSLLMPIEIEHQFRNFTDENAVNVCLAVVSEILCGMKPDREYRPEWTKLLNKWQAVGKIV